MRILNPQAGMFSGHSKGLLTALMLCVAGSWLTFSRTAAAQIFQDSFTNRQTITSANGQIEQDNSTASLEPNEPRHGGKPGGHSLWISWLAPTNGVIRFKTEASQFDTLLSAYAFTTTNGSTFADLREVARADDSDGLEHDSEIEFGVRTGERYEIAVDGYFGAVGILEFQWNLTPLPIPPPQILNTLSDYAVNLGDMVSLTFIVTNAGAGSYKWFLNGNEVGVTSTNLTIASFSPANVGRYTLRVSVGGVQFFSVPVELQINTEGSANTLAQGKLFDAPSTPLIGNPGGGAFLFRPRLPSGVVRGYNGSQIFNTTYAVVDTNEPPHCGIASSKSYWLEYQPPTNGTVTLDTLGSTYDTVMEVYTFNGVLIGYQSLISLDCANDSFTNNTASRIVLPVAKSRQYLIVVSGVGGGSGTAWLNYKLDANKPPTAPSLLSQPAATVVAAGAQVTLGANLAGSPPFGFSWRKNETSIAGASAPALFFPSVVPADSANYVLTVTNDLGVLNATLPLRVVIPPTCSLVSTANGLQMSYATIPGQRYTPQEASTVSGPWVSWTNSFVGDGTTFFFDLGPAATTFYRLRVE